MLSLSILKRKRRKKTERRSCSLKKEKENSVVAKQRAGRLKYNIYAALLRWLSEWKWKRRYVQYRYIIRVYFDCVVSQMS